MQSVSIRVWQIGGFVKPAPPGGFVPRFVRQDFARVESPLSLTAGCHLLQIELRRLLTHRRHVRHLHPQEGADATDLLEQQVLRERVLRGLQLPDGPGQRGVVSQHLAGLEFPILPPLP